MKTKQETEKYIDSYLDDVEESDSVFLQKISEYQKIKKDYYPYEYLFEYEIGKIYQYHFDDLKKSEEYYAHIFDKMLNDEENKGEFYFCLGDLYRDFNDLEKSKIYFHKCFEFHNKLKDKVSIEYQELSLRRLGQNYESQKNFDAAEKYYLKADKISRNTKYSGIALFLLGCLYGYILDDFKKAVEYALKAELLLKNQNHQIFENYRVLGYAYSNIKEFEKSEYYYKKVLAEHHENDYLYYVYRDIGKLYCHWKKEDMAIPYLEKGLQCLTENHESYKDEFQNTVWWLAAANEGNYNYKESLNITSNMLNNNSFDTYDDMIRILNCYGRVMQKVGDFLTGYYSLVSYIKAYEASKFFEKSNESYQDVLEIKNDLYKKLPIGNRLIEKLKQKCN